MIAFNYPPALGSSGLLRSVTFVRHLARSGWGCTVLTASERAHPQISSVQEVDVMPGVAVLRPWALDAARHLSIHGKFFGWTARPDRWASWYFSAVPAGLAECLMRRPSVIWSTYPTPTAHRIALALHRITGIPWVADFRDPLVASSRKSVSAESLERKVVQHAARIVFVSDSARDACMLRHPDKDPAAFVVIENGFDEEMFAGLGSPPPQQTSLPLKIVHSGTIYRDGRSPGALLDALREISASRTDVAKYIELVFRASTVDQWLLDEARQRNLERMVRLAPSISYLDALAEMCSSDGLLILQGREFNQQIPAKAYECLRAGRPILALADPAGETWRLLSSFDGVYLAPIDDPHAIAGILVRFVQEREARAAAPPDRQRVHAFSRQHGSERLCRLLRQVAESVP